MAITRLNNNSLTSITALPSAVAVSTTPAFHATKSANSNISSGTDTKIEFNSELFDTDNTYDNSSNYRFTPAVAGKYFVYGQVNASNSASEEYQYCLLYTSPSPRD